MTKRPSVPTARLVRLGSARAHTNANVNGNRFEDEISGPKYSA